MATTTAREVPTGRVSELIEGEEERFRRARPRSYQLWTEAREVLPRGVPSSFQDAAHWLHQVHSSNGCRPRNTALSWSSRRKSPISRA